MMTKTMTTIARKNAVSRDDDDDDDDLDVRGASAGAGRQPIHPMALTSMITGIVSVVFGVPGCTGCCCGIFTAIAAICGIVAITTGIMGKSPGSEAYTMTGIICGSVGLFLSLIGVALFIFSMTVQAGRLGMQGF